MSADVIEIDVELTGDTIELDVQLVDEVIDMELAMDTNVTVQPLPDLAYGGEDFIA